MFSYRNYIAFSALNLKEGFTKRPKNQNPARVQLFPSLVVDKSPESGVDPEDPKDDEEAERGLATNEFSLLVPF